jgi:hypothetical protein
LSHDVARDAKAWLVLTHLLCRAAVTPRANRRLGYTLHPGQCDETEEQLAQATGLTRKEVRGSLARLGQYGTITKGQISGQRRNVITLVNWAFYNPPAENRAMDGAEEGPTKGPTKGPRKGRERADPEEPKTIQEPEEKTTTNDVRALCGYVKDAVGYRIDTADMEKLVLKNGFWWMVEAAEHLAARPPAKRRCNNPPGFLGSEAKRALAEDGLDREGEYEPFENWRARQQKALDAKLKAITGGAA